MKFRKKCRHYTHLVCQNKDTGAYLMQRLYSVYEAAVEIESINRGCFGSGLACNYCYCYLNIFFPGFLNNFFNKASNKIVK